jgi:predicted nucleotide-binding protein
MTTVNKIRASLNETQRAVLNAVWEYHIEKDDRWAWMPTAALYRKFVDLTVSRKSGKDLVLVTLRSLNGSIIYEHQDHYYALTFLGALLTDEGQDGIDLLASCLKLFQNKYDSGQDLKEIHLSSQELATSLNLSEDKLRLLNELLEISRLGSIGGNKEQWTVSVTYWMDEFLFEDDLKPYVERQALKDYDPKIPSIYEEKTSYLQQKQSPWVMTPNAEGKIFIGHGRSPVWRDLKDFLQDRLHLEWDEFNREPVAGRSNKEVLSEKLSNAKFTFLVMTGEDQHSDQTTHARENVIHEAGLFQGRLGFERAIILLEEGCAEFTNVQGVSQIRFPKGNISAKFEEIRQVLEREGIIKTSLYSTTANLYDSI